jgi:acyl-coenzyme A synthetase/AMP-(fatty) acid ligase
VQLDHASLHHHLRQHLAPYKQPSEIRTVDSFPMTGSGKVLKRQLLELHAAG